MLNFLFTRTPLYFMTQSFWKDEAFSYLLAKRSLLDLIRLTSRDFNPPLYYILLHYWMRIFGSSEIALRSLSLVFFVCTVYVVFLFLQSSIKIEGKRIWLYLILFICNPALLYFAFEARMYSLFAFLATLSFYFFWKKEKTGYIIATILGLYTHYFFLFVAATQILYLMLYRKKPFLKNHRFIGTPLLFFLPWFLYIYATITTKTAQFWISTTTLKDIAASLGVLFTGYEPAYQFYTSGVFVVSLFFVVLLFFFAFRFSSHARRDSRLLLFLFLWSCLFYILTIVLSFVKPVFVFRYLIFATVGFNLLLFYLLEQAARKTRFIILAALFFITFHYTAFEVLYRKKGDVRKTVKEIKTLARAKDFLYVTDPALYFPAAYYFDEQRVYIYPNQLIPYYIGAVLIPDAKIIDKLPSYPQKAFILKDENTYDIQAVR